MQLKEEKLKSNNFITLCSNGELLPDEIDDYIDEWHDSDNNNTIYDFLGMTQEEYRLWVHSPEIFTYIITARVNNQNLNDILSSMNDKSLAARADSPQKAEQLMEWLKQTGI